VDADPVTAAFEATPRAWFLPGDQRERADYDGPLDIGFGQTNSQPRTVENMLRLLRVLAGQRVLDVGAGSGWTTALLAHLVGPAGEVRGVELEPTLARDAAEAVAATGRDWATVAPARSGVLGLPEGAPYDRILVSAAARRLPGALVDQLAERGVLVIPVAGVMRRVVRGDELTITEHGPYRFVPLR